MVDVLLAALIDHRGGSLWFEPAKESGHADAHRVSLEQGRREVAAALLGGGLGDAAIARLALLCGLDLLERRAQTGRCQARAAGRPIDLIVTVRPTRAGLGAEVRVLDDGAPAKQAAPAPPLPERLPDGTSIGSYRVLGLLGRGGMGLVYRAQHTVIGREFAVKVLRRSLLREDPDSARRFVREARAAARIHHPDIVDVTDFGTLADGRPYLVMELLDGRSLSEVVAGGALAPARAVALARRVAAALGAAHAAGVIHRDLTPSNVFVTDRDGVEQIKLVDFGGAYFADPDQADVPDGPPGMVLGTPYYMSPEQARGIPTDQRTDIYSLGVVLYQMLSGAVPFEGSSGAEIIRKHVFDAAPPASSPLEALPDELERVVARMLRKDPAERQQTAAELLVDLERVADLLGRSGWRRWLPV